MEDAASVLRDIDGVLGVSSNLVTGSLLVMNDPEVIEENDLLEIARDAQIVGEAVSAVTGESGNQLAESSQLAQSIMQGFSRFDRLVSHWTNGLVDGKTLIAFLLLGTAVSRALMGRKQTPAPWYALFWYGYSAFMHWNKPGQAQQS